MDGSAGCRSLRRIPPDHMEPRVSPRDPSTTLQISYDRYQTRQDVLDGKARYAQSGFLYTTLPWRQTTGPGIGDSRLSLFLDPRRNGGLACLHSNPARSGRTQLFSVIRARRSRRGARPSATSPTGTKLEHNSTTTGFGFTPDIQRGLELPSAHHTVWLAVSRDRYDTPDGGRCGEPHRISAGSPSTRRALLCARDAGGQSPRSNDQRLAHTTRLGYRSTLSLILERLSIDFSAYYARLRSASKQPNLLLLFSKAVPVPPHLVLPVTL